MPRQRQPAAILELRGSYVKNPQRRREDLPGAGPFDPVPPTSLDPASVPAWGELVARLPRIAMTSSDEHIVEVTAVTLTKFRLTHDYRAGLALRALLAELGMTPAARMKLAGPPQPKPSKFAWMRDAKPAES